MKQLWSQLRATRGSPLGRSGLMAGLFVVGLIACFAIRVSAASAPTYSVTDLGVLTGMDISEPAAINTQGMVTGTASGGKGKCAFLYRDGRMEDIGGVGSRGFGINLAGVVVGDSTFSAPEGSASHAAMFGKGDILDLGVLKGGKYSRANGINVFNQVVGFSGPQCDSVNSRAFVWNALTGMLDIGTLGGAYAQAWAVNDAGFVTGNAQTGGERIGATHAFLYQIPRGEGYEKPMQDLQTLGGVSSYGLAINAYNHVVGYSEISLTDNRIHASFFGGGENAGLVDLGSLGGGTREADHSVALAINSTDQVVGYTYALAGGNNAIRQVAFIYDCGNPASPKGMIDLNQLIGKAAKRYILLSAMAISDKGQIVASAFDQKTDTYRAVLLTPVDRQPDNQQ